MTGRLGLRHVDHLAFAVPSIREALTLFGDLLGGEFVNGGDEPALGIRTVQLRLPPGLRVELLEPATPDSYLHEHLATRGPGFHHLTVMVADAATALVELGAAGYETTGTRMDDGAWRQTYVRPRSGHGVLIQVVESDIDWDRPHPEATLEQVLGGAWEWRGGRSVRRSATAT